MGVTYEVYGFKGGNWNIDSVYDDREMALYEARMLLDSRYLTAVRVIEERYNESTGDTVSRIVFKQQKGVDRNKVAPKVAAEKPGARIRPDTKKKPKKPEKNLFNYAVVLTLSVGGLGLGLIALLFYLMNVFGSMK